MPDLKPLADQTVIVIGASSGIGRATAQEFVRRGVRRIVIASRGVDALTTLADELREQAAEVVEVPTDITDPTDVEELVATAEDRFGGVHTVVVAPAVSVYGTVEDITLEEFRRVLEVNFLGQVSVAKVAVPAIERAGGGTLIGIGSVESYRAVPLHAPYTASKFALRAFFDTMRMELAEAGSPVELVLMLPASIGTPFFEHSRSKTGSMPKPPPPVYAPELVAEEIVRAATQPRHEIPVGDSAFGFIAGQRFSPALTSAVLSVTGSRAQQSDRPDDGTDILETPTPGPGSVHGAYADQLVTTSPMTKVAHAALRPGEMLLRARRRGARR